MLICPVIYRTAPGWVNITIHHWTIVAAGDEFISGNIKKMYIYIYTVSKISQYWVGAGIWNPSWWKTRTGQFILPNQYHGCWWPGNGKEPRHQQLSLLTYARFNTRRGNSLCGLVTPYCSEILVQIDSMLSNKWFVTCCAPSHYLNPCWLTVNWTLMKDFSKIPSKTWTYSCREMHLKMSLANWQSFCLGLMCHIN